MSVSMSATVAAAADVTPKRAVRVLTRDMTMMRHARELVFSPGIARNCARNEVARGGGIWVTVVVPSVGLVCPDDVAPQSPPSLLLSANRLFFAAIRTRRGERPNARATSSCAWWIFSP